MQLEGIICKQERSPYRSGRQDSWIKVKCTKSGTYPIVAFVEKRGAKPRRAASLYLGRWDGDRLLYAGKARSGYTDAVLRDLRERLDPYIRTTSPLSVPIKKPKDTWVEPVLPAEVNYSALTADGLLVAPASNRLVAFAPGSFIDTSTFHSAASSRQYHLANSDGRSWSAIDPSTLAVTVTPRSMANGRQSPSL